jgi:hypothetical protein
MSCRLGYAPSDSASSEAVTPDFSSRHDQTGSASPILEFFPFLT